MELTARLARSLGLLDLGHVAVAAPEVAGDDELCTVHSPEFVAAVRRVSSNPDVPDLERGLGTDDDPAFAGMHEASARLAGGSLLAAGAILDGSAVRAVNFGGGMHHAARDRASGFCIYNDAALAIQKLLDGGVQRVAYIDVDAHHGDGTQSIFWDDPRVLTISPARDRTDAVPRHGLRQRDRRPASPGQRSQRCPSVSDGRRRLAAGFPCRGAAADRGLRTRGYRQPARLRLAPAIP